MTRTLCTLLAVALAGCSPKPDGPQTAGGHTIDHWRGEAKKPDPKTRKKAVKELGHLGATDPAAVTAVAGALKDADPAVRAEAALALLNLGPAALAAESALQEATKDKDAKVREYAVKALESVRRSP